MTEAEPQSIRELTRRVLRHRLVIAAAFVVVFGGVLAYTLTATPRYRSEARLRIEQKQQSSPGSAISDQVSSATSAIPGASLLGISGRDELETEIGVLRSDRMSDATIDSLALMVQVKTPAASRARILTAKVLDPMTDVDGAITLTQKTPGHYAVEKSDLDEVHTLPPTIAAGDSMRVGGEMIRLSQDLARGGPDKIVIRMLPRYKVHKLLDARLDISRQEGGSRLVEVSYQDADRVLASQVVSRLIREFTDYTNITEETEDTITVGQLKYQVDSTSRQLAAAEMALKTFEERSKLIAPQDQATAQVKRISTISAKVDAISSERNALARMLDIIGQRSKGGTDVAAYRQLATFPSLITNRAIQDLLQSLVDLENKRAALGAKRTEFNAEYKAYTDRIGEIETQLFQLGPQYLESLDQQMRTTAATVTALTDTLGEMPAAAMQYGRLLRDRTLLEAVYLTLQKQLKQAQLKDVLRVDRVKIIDTPRVANVKDVAFPKKPVMIALGFILGVILALTAALAVELWQPTP